MLQEPSASLQTWLRPRTTPCTHGIKKPWSKRSESLKGMDPSSSETCTLPRSTTTRVKRRCRSTTPRPRVWCPGCQDPRKAQGQNGNSISTRAIYFTGKMEAWQRCPQNNELDSARDGKESVLCNVQALKLSRLKAAVSPCRWVRSGEEP